MLFGISWGTYKCVLNTIVWKLSILKITGIFDEKVVYLNKTLYLSILHHNLLWMTCPLLVCQFDIGSGHSGLTDEVDTLFCNLRPLVLDVYLRNGWLLPNQSWPQLQAPHMSYDCKSSEVFKEISWTTVFHSWISPCVGSCSLFV